MQELIVGLIVVYAAVAVVLRYAPATARRGMRRLFATALRRIGLQRLAAFYASDRPRAGCSDGCSNCSGCGTPDRASPSVKLAEMPVKVLQPDGHPADGGLASLKRRHTL